MKTPWVGLMLTLLIAGNARAQRGTITIASNCDITIPNGAVICADIIYANGPGYGSLNYLNASCICTGAIIITVELITFSALYENGFVVLNWRTASEINCGGYEIQRSTENHAWQVVGYVRGKGTTTQEQAYRYDDRLPSELIHTDIIRYRLRIIEMDGSFSYSPIAEVCTDAAMIAPVLFGVYPNPASDMLTVPYFIADDKPVRISVYTMEGREMMSFTDCDLSGCGFHVFSINTARLAGGAYFITLTDGGAHQSRQVVVRHS